MDSRICRAEHRAISFLRVALVLVAVALLAVVGILLYTNTLAGSAYATTTTTATILEHVYIVVDVYQYVSNITTHSYSVTTSTVSGGATIPLICAFGTTTAGNYIESVQCEYTYSTVTDSTITTSILTNP